MGEPGSTGVHPEAIIGDVMVEGEGEVPALHEGPDTSASDGDISGEESDGSEDEEDGLDVDDNFNSAGEEVSTGLIMEQEVSTGLNMEQDVNMGL